MSGSGSGPLAEVTCVRGESFVVSSGSGDVHEGGDQGFFVRDTRFLDRLEVTVDGRPPSPLHAGVTGPGTATFHGFVPRTRSRATDPTLLTVRQRRVEDGLRETVVLDNRGREEEAVVVEVHVGTDLATIFDVKHATDRPQVAVEAVDGALRLGRGRDTVTVRPQPPAELTGDGLRWRCTVPPGGQVRFAIEVDVTDRYGPAVAPPAEVGPAQGDQRSERGRGLGQVGFACSETRMTRLVRRSLDDLASLTVEDPEEPRDRFYAAGSPWFLTLFGRDSLWSAFAVAPFDLELAGGTLRALARRQGTRHHLPTEEAPGKILHEVRRGALTHEQAFPPNYYGSVDATPLFVMVASEAWRWGLPHDQVAALIGNVEAALGWLRDDGLSADGFVRYERPGEIGLVNQGWKDSHDGIQHRDGTLARPPIALIEVQAYAYEAAVRGAELLDRFGRPGGDGWRRWAAQLRDRVRDRFWVEDDAGRYLAVALDGDGVPVDTVTSNLGHVLVTDLLDGDERAAVARRLGDATMDSGWGLRTLSSASAGYNPLGYHTGSVWPHDTAIAIWGLARSGHAAEATGLLRGLVRAAPHLRYRLPELFGGFGWTPGGYPVPYPVACRPQAWAAAAAALLVRACLGVEAHLPDGEVRLRPLAPAPFRHLELRGLPLAGGEVDVVVDADGGVRVDRRGTEVTLILTGRS